MRAQGGQFDHRAGKRSSGVANAEKTGEKFGSISRLAVAKGDKISAVFNETAEIGLCRISEIGCRHVVKLVSAKHHDRRVCESVGIRKNSRSVFVQHESGVVFRDGRE